MRAPRRWLHQVVEGKAPLAAIAEQTPVERGVLRGRYDQDLSNPRQHQDRQRIENHRLVVDRQQLLGDDPRHRVQAGTVTAGQDDPLN